MPITTRCSHCGRLFPVHAQQLKERRGKVDCPQCGARFDGITGLVDEAMPGDAANASQRETRGHRQDDATEPAPMMTFDDGEERPARVASTLWVLGILMLLAVLAAQIFWWERGTWLHHPLVREVYGELCTQFDLCQPVPRIAGSLEILPPVLSEHPLDDRILRLDLTLINRSEQLQRPPRLQLELFDSDGDLLAVRRFEPNEYLADASPMTVLPAGGATNIALELAALPEPAMNFRIQLY